MPSTILSGRSRSTALENPTDNVWEHRDLNPGLLGEKRERYLCAMPPPRKFYYLIECFLEKVSRESETFTI